MGGRQFPVRCPPLRLSRKTARLGLNVSIAVFVGFSVYGFILYMDGGMGTPHSSSLLATVFYAVSILGSIACIAFFGRQVDLRDIEEARRNEGRRTGKP